MSLPWVSGQTCAGTYQSILLYQGLRAGTEIAGLLPADTVLKNVSCAKWTYFCTIPDDLNK
jgi:hypothetical protein